MNAEEAHIDGYVGDVAYPFHFHREQMPTWLHATATALGFRAPDISRPYRWCELGCGAGLGALVAAACNPGGRFTAIDANAAQVARAQAIADRAGLANLEFVHADLRDHARNADGEGFDFIVLHGLWAWVSDEVRAAILGIVQRRLAPGGIVAVGYMSHPGASPLQSAQRLMHQAAQRLQGDSATRGTSALRLLRQLADGGSGYFAEHPGALRQLEAMEAENAHYLAHEFLGAHWHPQHSAEVIGAFASVDCGYLGSATPIENIDALSIPGHLQPLLRTLPPGPLAETARDIARNQSLRRDLYQRTPQALDAAGHLAALDALVFAALPAAPRRLDADLHFDTRIGPVNGPRELFAPVLQALAEQACSFAGLRRLAPFEHAPGLLNQVMQTLCWAGLAHPCQPITARADVDALARQLSGLPGMPPLALHPGLGTATQTMPPT